MNNKKKHPEVVFNQKLIFINICYIFYKSSYFEV